MRKGERKRKGDDEIVRLVLVFKLVRVGNGGEMEGLLAKEFLDMEIEILVMGIEQ